MVDKIEAVPTVKGTDSPACDSEVARHESFSEMHGVANQSLGDAIFDSNYGKVTMFRNRSGYEHRVLWERGSAVIAIIAVLMSSLTNRWMR
jgi:hypothetical protein